MRCYNGCPDKELQALLDDSELAKRELEALGLHATWFPMEQGWVVFRGLHPINDDFYPSRRAAANAMRSRTMTEPQPYEYKEDRELPDGDYILSDGCAWFTVGIFSVRIRQTSEGVDVDVYPVGKENDDSIASCSAFASDVTD